MSDDDQLKVVKVAWKKCSFIETCKITVLVEDNSNKESGLLHKHGLSFLIETTSKNEGEGIVGCSAFTRGNR